MKDRLIKSGDVMDAQHVHPQAGLNEGPPTQERRHQLAAITQTPPQIA